jgi:hypothetical protein
MVLELISFLRAISNFCTVYIVWFSSQNQIIASNIFPKIEDHLFSVFYINTFQHICIVPVEDDVYYRILLLTL